MTDKKDDKITEAGAVEIEESELDQVTGGTSYLKLGDIKGEEITKGDGYDKSIDILSHDWGTSKPGKTRRP
ncbi:MAG: hypothetical protein ABJN65_16565 [Parasphingorhabdus sp.]